MKMNRISLAVLPLLFSAAAAFAQAPQSSIRESTDPARVAEVERRAQELRSGQTSMSQGGSAAMQAPMTGRHGAMHHDGMRHDGRGHRGHHSMHNDHPKGAPKAAK
jgi:hypothetical protein